MDSGNVSALHLRTGRCMSVKRGHEDEVLDVSFDACGNKFVSASADGTARVYNTMTGACLHSLVGHEGEISKTSFNPQGTRVITASSDKTCRIWDVEEGQCLQVRHLPVLKALPKTFAPRDAPQISCALTSFAPPAQLLEGHTDEIFSCAFNYEGDFIITGSKDNTCRIWRSAPE